MSHERDPDLTGGGRLSPPREHGLFQRLRRHLREWPRRYVEMRVRAVEDRSS
ncbi:hypothetical protein [Halobellus rufus]|uniref:hypothetical protein n=1 Tax=Halobellus rufus TaxID=1448860 RepID=UPI0018CFB8FB|nr:hypothetical protein [Halobellus rufus]